MPLAANKVHIMQEHDKGTTLRDGLAAGVGLQLEGARCLFSEQSPWQCVEVWQTPALGRVFTLDGCFMTAEADEFIYHENLVHPAALSHGQPRSALIIGGGDGGSARELLRYASLQQITVVELDEVVVRMARQWLPSVHAGALDDPRVRLLVADGYDWVMCSPERFDLIVLDLSDPHGQAQRLYTPGFYRACAERLHPGGLLSLHVGSPVWHGQRCCEVVHHLQQALPVVRPLLTSIPLYGGSWLMAVAARDIDPAAVSVEALRQRLQQQVRGTLRHYTPQLHGAQMQLPLHVQAVLAGQK